MKLLHHLGGLRADRRGAALVEFTLLAPILISLVCGLAEFGRALRQYHVMEKAVRDSGRYLARSWGVACPAADSDWSTAVDYAKTLAVTGQQDGSAAVLPSWSDKTTVSVTVSCLDNSAGAYRGDPSLAVVTVTARAPYDDLGMLSAIGLTTPTLTVSHQELKLSA